MLSMTGKTQFHGSKTTLLPFVPLITYIYIERERERESSWFLKEKAKMKGKEKIPKRNSKPKQTPLISVARNQKFYNTCTFFSFTTARSFQITIQDHSTLHTSTSLCKFHFSPRYILYLPSRFNPCLTLVNLPSDYFNPVYA